MNKLLFARPRIKVLENQLHAKQNLDKGVDQNA